VPSYNSYDPDGNLIEQWHGNPNGMERRQVCRYDRDRKLVEQEYLGTSMTTDRKFSYQYDASGRRERVIATATDGSERVYESYRYNAQGCKTVTIYPGKPPEGCGVSIDCLLRWPGDAVAVMTLFDEPGRPTREVFYGENDRVIRRVAFRHDTVGNLLEEGEMEPGGAIREDFRNVYRYDAHGRQIEADIRCYDFGGHIVRTIYNEYGDIAERRLYPREGIVTSRSEQRPWATRYTYRYDDRGNWIERISANGVLPDGPFTARAEDRRELSYY
jgi:hypothetical protein